MKSEVSVFFFFFQAEDGIRDKLVTGVQTCALPIYLQAEHREAPEDEEVEPAGERLAHPRHLGADELLLPQRDGDHRPQPPPDAIDREGARGRAPPAEPAPAPRGAGPPPPHPPPRPPA